MIGFKLGLLFLQKSSVKVHNSAHNVKKERKCVVKYTKENS